MKNIKLNKIYKLESKNSILVDINFNCIQYILLINKDSLKYIIKSLKKEKITDAIHYYCKYVQVENKVKKTEVPIKYLDNILNKLNIKYTFIGKYLLNLEYENYNYIIDFINDTIEKCQFLETFNDNKKADKKSDKKSDKKYEKKYDKKSDKKSKNKIIERYECSSDSNSSDCNNNSSDSDNNVNVLKKIEKINLFGSQNNFSDELNKLLNFSINNSEVMKPVLNLINSKTNNLIGNFINSSGIDYNLENESNFTDLVTEISKSLKIIEELNNNDILEIKVSTYENFNFIISEIWNQMKKIINLLNKASRNDDYESMLVKYQNNIYNLDLDNNKIIDNIMIYVISDYICKLETKILYNYRNLTESSILEINILLQNYNNHENVILDSKLNDILEKNFVLYNCYFTDIYMKEDFVNIFSEFNKQIHFNNILNSLEKTAKAYIILKINNFTSKSDIYNNEFINNIENKVRNTSNHTYDTKDTICETNSLLSFEKNEDILETSYKKYKKIINIEYKTNDLYIDKINKNYKDYLLIKNKKDISSLLVKFHEEVRFKLAIINKIRSSNST